MGLLIDTDVLILAERHRGQVEFARWEPEGEAFISVITASELLVGVHRADTPQRRNRRAAFVESLLAQIPILDIDLETARVHAQVLGSLPKAVTVGAHDLLIGATALRHGLAVLTRNTSDFSNIPGLRVLPFSLAV